MSVVRLSIVEFAYPHQTRMLADVSLDISAGWTAIVGPNGAGKSTLVRLICGDLQARQGSIVSPFSCRTSQEPDFQIVAEFTQEWGKNAAFWKSLFGLDFVDLNSWSSLSPGWKHRWMLGAVFWRNPPLLVLDEPTNHLDLEGRDLLIRAMSRYDGVGLVVSHDRAFLNQTTTETIWVENGRVEHFKCGLEPAVDRVRAQKRSQLDSLNDAQAQLKTAQMQVHQVAATHDASKRSLSVKSRMKNAGDRDAGTDARKIRAQMGGREECPKVTSNAPRSTWSRWCVRMPKGENSKSRRRHAQGSGYFVLKVRFGRGSAGYFRPFGTSSAKLEYGCKVVTELAKPR